MNLGYPVAPLILLLLFLNCASFWDGPKLSMSLLTQSHQVFFPGVLSNSLNPWCPFPCSGVLVAREKMRSSKWFLLVGDRKGIWPQKLCFYSPSSFLHILHNKHASWMPHQHIVCVAHIIDTHPMSDTISNSSWGVLCTNCNKYARTVINKILPQDAHLEFSIHSNLKSIIYFCVYHRSVVQQLGYWIGYSTGRGFQLWPPQYHIPGYWPWSSRSHDSPAPPELWSYGTTEIL